MNENSLEVKVLMKLKKPDLVARCRKNGLKVSGNKKDLAIRIANFEASGVGAKKTTKTTTTRKSSTPKEPEFNTDTLELRYSLTKKIPYIQLGVGRFIFSVNTENRDKGFKYIVFNGFVMKREGRTSINFTTNVEFTKIPKDAKKGIGNVNLNFLKRTIGKLTVDGFFPRENLPELERIINGSDNNDEDYIDDDPTATESFDDDE